MDNQKIVDIYYDIENNEYTIEFKEKIPDSGYSTNELSEYINHFKFIDE